MNWRPFTAALVAILVTYSINTSGEKTAEQLNAQENDHAEPLHRDHLYSRDRQKRQFTPPPPKPETPEKPPSTTTAAPPDLAFLKNVSDISNSSAGNESMWNSTTTLVPTTPSVVHDLPQKGAAEAEHHSSFTIFFILIVVAIAILLTHLLITTKFHYLPESIAVVLVGALIGLILKLFKVGNFQQQEAFPPTIFFIVLLPPIIFESGYNLHKGNFFHNIGSILVFAVFGTVISALVVGGGIYLLGEADIAYRFDLIESFAFGSMISAVDPVATLAIFHALDADPILYMLVFGESVLNDAVSIVLTTTVLELESPAMVNMSGAATFFYAVGRFCLMFFASAAIGVACGIVSALLLKFVNLHKTPSLEFGLMLVFSYLPYGLAEGIHLSGIMAILFCAIVMSHYTHLNLSPVTQITTQLTFRTIAFIAETCVFAYLGLAIFSFKVVVKPAFVIWSVVLILIGRGLNIFPLAFLVNFFREHKITRKMQFIMWFSGLRGAIAFALSLHLEFEEEKRHVLVTATLIIVLFTIIFLGGATMPLMKCLNANTSKKRKRKKIEPEVSLSKTKEMGDTVDSEHLSELTEEEYDVSVVRPHLKGFLKFDAKYLVPFFTRRFTQQEVREGRNRMDHLTKQWYQEVRAAPSESESDIEMEETKLVGNGNHVIHHSTVVVPEHSTQDSVSQNSDTFEGDASSVTSLLEHSSNSSPYPGKIRQRLVSAELDAQKHSDETEYPLVHAALKRQSVEEQATGTERESLLHAQPPDTSETAPCLEEGSNSPQQSHSKDVFGAGSVVGHHGES